MDVIIKKCKLSKSIINQLQYIGTLPKNDNYEVLGYVIIPKKVSKVIIKTSDGNYWWASNIKNIETVCKNTQFTNPDKTVGGYIYPERTHVKIWTFEGKAVSFSAEFNESENLKLKEKAENYLNKIKKAGQIYY